MNVFFPLCVFLFIGVCCYVQRGGASRRQTRWMTAVAAVLMAVAVLNYATSPARAADPLGAGVRPASDATSRQVGAPDVSAGQDRAQQPLPSPDLLQHDTGRTPEQGPTGVVHRAAWAC